jgi:ribonuclease PH
LALAIQKLMDAGQLEVNPIKKQVAAISVGVVNSTPVTDLCYQEDSKADTDMNVIMSSLGGFIEVQGTAEGEEFDKKQLDTLLSLAKSGCNKIFKAQSKVLG